MQRAEYTSHQAPQPKAKMSQARHLRGRADQLPSWGSTLERKRASTGYGATAAAHIACTLPPRIPPRCTKYLHGSLVHHTRGKKDPLPGKRQRAMNPTTQCTPRQRQPRREAPRRRAERGTVPANNPRGLPSSSNPKGAYQRWCRRPAPPSTVGFLYPDAVRSLAPHRHPTTAVVPTAEDAPGGPVNSGSGQVGVHDTTHPARGLLYNGDITNYK